MTSKNAEAGLQPVTDCNRLGNASKMREMANAEELEFHSRKGATNDK